MTGSRPNILWYARLDYSTEEGRKTAKYATKQAAGYYPPMDTQKNKNGAFSFYLLTNRNIKDGMPAVRLEGQNTSLNLTGLHFLSESRCMSRFAYGFPNPNKTYTNKQRRRDAPNPFYSCRNDCFFVHPSRRPTDPLCNRDYSVGGRKGAGKCLLSDVEKWRFRRSVDAVKRAGISKQYLIISCFVLPLFGNNSSLM